MVKGKIYAKTDPETIKQFENCLKEDFTICGALMPDAHYGYVAPIGSVIITKDKIVPAWVGYDIGCGVIAIKLKGPKLFETIKKESKRIHKLVEKNIPMGLGGLNPEHKISEETSKKFSLILEELKSHKIDDELFDWIKRKAKSNLGTLGHGNHFIEIDTSVSLENKPSKNHKSKLEIKGKDAWLIVHTGSRNVGHHCASHYMKKAMELASEKNNHERTFALDASSKIGKEYLAVQGFCLEFALLNRLEIVHEIIESMKDLGIKLTWEVWANKNHNHVEETKGRRFIHRKGATPSRKNERGVIPANMRDGTFLVTGKGNKDFLESSSHGAGRSMSKRAVKEKITMKEFKDSMKGIVATVEIATLDESPFAYKNIFSVMRAQKHSVKIYKHLLPIINWKGK